MLLSLFSLLSWAGNTYLLPITSYVETPNIKQNGERGIQLSLYYTAFDVKGSFIFSDESDW